MVKMFIALLISLSVPVMAMAGEFAVLEPVATTCSIEEITTGYSVDKNKLTLKATIGIINDHREKVAGAEISTGWTEGKKPSIMVDCTTDANGECTVEHTIKGFRGRKSKNLPQMGVRVLTVACPGLEYLYIENSTFAWAILN